VDNGILSGDGKRNEDKLMAMALLIVVTIVMFCCLLLVLVGCVRSSRRRKKAQVIIPVRPTIKILAPIMGLLTIILLENLPFPLPFPFSLFFVITVFSGVLLFFCTDIIVNSDGVYLGLMSKPMSWERIKTIRDYPSYLEVMAHRKRESKQYIKFIWKIKDEDVTKLQSLLAEKANQS
jgi:amino acid transporter